MKVRELQDVLAEFVRRRPETAEDEIVIRMWSSRAAPVKPAGVYGAAHCLSSSGTAIVLDPVDRLVYTEPHL